MGLAKLLIKLRLDSGEDISEDTARELYEAHKTVFSKYWAWVYEVGNRYKSGEPLVTNDGWVLFCDNPSIPSVRNFLVQGNGASITRKALILLAENGLSVLCGLHDAVYVECLDTNIEEVSNKIRQYMKQATEEILGVHRVPIRLDLKVIPHSETWVEEKGYEDWNKLKGFLT